MATKVRYGGYILELLLENKAVWYSNNPQAGYPWYPFGGEVFVIKQVKSV